MNLGIGSKLFLASVAVIVVVEVTAAIALRAEVRATLDARAEAELAIQAETARIGLESLPDLAGPRAQELATRIAAATRTEIEVFDSTGHVLADSSPGVSGDVLSFVEVQRALDPADGRGFARRGGRILVARPFRYGDGLGVVRVSTSRSDLSRAYRRLWLLLTIGAATGLIAAIAMTLAATTLVRRSLRRLAGSAAEVATGSPRRIAVEAGDGEIGRVGGLINRLADDAERTVSALQLERALFGSVLDGMTQGVIAIDGERHMTLVNPSARSILDLPGVPIGEPFLDHVRIPSAVTLVEDALAGGGTATAEFTTPGGARVLARVSPQRSGSGCILVLDDVTAIRRLETIRRDFVANVSHELRTPVSVIRANAETLMAGAKDDPRFADRLIEGLHRNAERLSRIISDLLDLSRLEAGQVRIESAPLAVAAAAAQACSVIEAQAAARPVTVSIEVPPDLMVQADAMALDHVLVNLIDNAVKYTNPGGNVWVRARRRTDRVRIEIADDGPGIAAHHRERIFERFYRVDAGRSREVGGTGLGLSIVRHLVDSLGGQVGVDGNEPTGAVFWIESAGGLRPTARRHGNCTDDHGGVMIRAMAAKAHTDREYESELRQLKDKLLKMAGLVEDMIARATGALVRGDIEVARATLQMDTDVNRLEVETDEMCLIILARRQPLASDLRMITLAMKMVTDLERIGDLAVNICERVMVLGGPPPPSVAERLTKMSEIGQKMIRDAIDGFVAGDVTKAREVLTCDQAVDDGYRELTMEVQAEMMKRPDFVDRGIHLAAVAKFLERIADHGTNLAEMVIFKVEGKDVRHKPSRFDVK